MTEISGYHAHVYFTPATRHIADSLRTALATSFALQPGGLSDAPRGPHPISQFNTVFRTEDFQTIVPWLMLNRRGLDVLIHPLTDDMLDDHTIYAAWLGTPVNLKLDTLQRRGYGTELLPEAQTQPA
jgi:DOPA 4,5-dioxygenase